MKTSRYGERQKKRKQNLILNGLIAVVLVLIVLVGINLLKDPSSPQETHVANENKDGVQTNEKNIEEKQSDEEEPSKDLSEEEDVEEEDGYQFVGGGPSGPWEPIGTKQTGEHTLQFNKGTLDWEEMEMALAYGAGIDWNNMTVLWLGNGGSPERAKGRVKSNDEQNKIYHVTIEWVDNKGWKPIDVYVEG